MHSIVGASVSLNAMQARAAWLVRRGWCGLNHVKYDTTENTISVHVCMGICHC